MAQAHFTDTDQGSSEPEHPGSGARRLFGGRWRGDPGVWRRGIVIAVLAVLLTLVLLFHGQLPNTVGNLGSLTETFLPWLGLGVPVLLVLAVLRRSATALIALLLPVIVWFNAFGGQLTDKSGTGGDLVVATHNVNAQNPDPVGTAKKVAASGADVVALEELAAGKVSTYVSALAATYPYHSVQGTVGLWSKYPMSDTKPVDIRLGWVRALRSTVATPKGKVAVYVAHLPSVRVKIDAGFTASQRDESADALGHAIAKEPLHDVVLLGDLNGTMNDRSLNAVTAQMRSAQGAAGNGFGFSWPAKFPMARIDQIMVKGADPVSSWTLPRTDSDHLPIAARLKL
ncbi:endonuclease/exonuclease/phosphatase family protein [Streptomyces sp. NBC_01387]|uniref:endonuclease/exonuclease/phosphatase family protein n=1 Tax=unclassified Streptomyces TaxID=2593676 RepID=UPI002024F4C3|nr:MULTISPECIES: endonuclease/exonuclease/phosphatase family protein [unclassified Streptomyces]MCX4551486.1 endonuclease/exonuclease/phosphatase family protein [Streptomyces sp. NBC_01500]WSC22872.1 endonuclease/exonuclease/phosphatase family protein [Streptomyces sp. NBC_01766]WSV56783.1 endonuclease/exonuclease/phosphatase family protein [Streptomyces sp. NBC_01014]